VLQVYRVTKKAADSVSVPAVNYPSAAYQDVVAATKEQQAVAAKKKTAEIDLTAPPPAKKNKVAKDLEDMTIDELQAKYRAKLNVIQVRGPSARNKAWLIDKINGGLTVRAKRAQGKQGGGGGKRARTAK
jgi:hypothetical protein